MAWTKEQVVGYMDNTLVAWGQKKQTATGIGAVYDMWATRKAGLIELMRNHPNWNEDAHGIVSSTKVHREVDTKAFNNAIRKFEDRFWRGSNNMNDSMYEIYKIIRDYFGKNNTINQDLYDRLVHKLAWLNSNTSSASRKAQLDELYKFLAVGMKQARFMNKFFEVEGSPAKLGKIVNSQGREVNFYDKWFAELADTVSPHDETLVTVLSVHPCDYMNMSRGTGWHSCHNMGGGGWQAGCISYMLDDCSAVLYTVSAKNEIDYSLLHTMEKINRQMYMFNDTGTLLASRLYPNYEDGDKMRDFMRLTQDMVLRCLGIESGTWNAYKLGNGTSTYNKYVTSGEGARQYKDYTYNQYHTTLLLLDGREHKPLVIGAKPVSLSAGIEFEGDAGDLFGQFEICADCGKLIDKRSGKYTAIDGKFYCTDCAFTCPICGKPYFTKDVKNTDVHNGYRVCDTCWEANSKPCQFCGEVSFVDTMIRGRSAAGRYNGKFAHARCVPTDKYGICRCGSYQPISEMASVHTPTRDIQLCTACTGVVTEWVDSFVSLPM